jgi:replicative DNA helicase
MKTLKDVNFKELLESRKQKSIGPMIFIEPIDKKVYSMPRRFVVLGGFSGSFKTTMALNIAYNNAIDLGYNVLFLSLEMDSNDLFLRLLVLHAQNPKFYKCHIVITVDDVAKGHLSKSQEEFLYSVVVPDLTGNNNGILCITTPQDIANITDIQALLVLYENKLQTEYGRSGSDASIDLLVIDYIQLFARMWRHNTGKDDQFQTVADIARALKSFTLSYKNGMGLTILALSQLLTRQLL